jgi:hypothetical protein
MILTNLPFELLKLIHSYSPNLQNCNKFTLLLVSNKIYSYNLTNDQLDIITKYYKNLNQLTLFNCKLITQNGIKYINRLTNLKILDLSYSNLTDWRISELKYLPNLEVLNLTYCFRLSKITLLNILYAFLNLKKLNITKCYNFVNYINKNDQLLLFLQIKAICPKLTCILLSNYTCDNNYFMSKSLTFKIEYIDIDYLTVDSSMQYTKDLILRKIEKRLIKLNLLIHLRYYNY